MHLFYLKVVPYHKNYHQNAFHTKKTYNFLVTVGTACQKIKRSIKRDAASF